MKQHILTLVTVFGTLAALAGCSDHSRDQANNQANEVRENTQAQAESIREQGKNQADATKDQAGQMADSTKNNADEKASILRNRSEQKADAIEKRGEQRADAIEDATKDSKLSKNEIQTAQKQLKQLGFYNGKVDGDWNLETSQAVRKFQQDRKLTVTNRLDHRTREQLDRATS